MPRYINAETKVTLQLFDDEHEEYITREMTVEEALDSFTEEGCPTMVDAEPVKHGHWVVSDSFAECSCCGMITTRNELMGISLFGKNEPNYCPNCGAKMEEVDATETGG